MDPRDLFDVSLEDHDLWLEVALTSDLMVAANQSAGPLRPHDIDRILRVSAAE